MLRKVAIAFIKLFLLWVLIFDFQRLLFSIHNWGKLASVGWGEWLMAFVYSLRLDIATASALVILPFICLLLYILWPQKIFRIAFYVLLVAEFVLVGMVHCGEINAYEEWNHKLTSRVFMHLANPDEVVRSADYGMTIWFFIYLFIEVSFSWKVLRWLFGRELPIHPVRGWLLVPAFIGLFAVWGSLSVVLLRGGIQQIPININSASYSNHPQANDVSINSLYFFANSYRLYNRSDIDRFIPKVDTAAAHRFVKELYTYPRQHDQYFLSNKRPNIVFVVMESWAAEAIGCLSQTKGATPNFDRLAGEGLLFTNIYGTAHTSEIGNASIFSGFPSVPEVSITLQPEKSRKLKAINQSLKPLGYTSAYTFSGDLKYGNIGGFFLDHGFDNIQDESDFPSGIKRGKLNYYDADLYKKFIADIRQTKQPFLQCAFTGSTHSPFDVPKVKGQHFKGNEADFMNALVYADKCLGNFVRQVKKESWYKNTLFVFVADHSHTTPNVSSTTLHAFYRIPLLFWGPVIKDEYQGKRMDILGSQYDIPATLLYQMGISSEDYPWSKDLMNPQAKPFAFHCIIDGYGWVSSKGFLTYQMMLKQYFEEQLAAADKATERKHCHQYLYVLNDYYKKL